MTSFYQYTNGTLFPKVGNFDQLNNIHH